LLRIRATNTKTNKPFDSKLNTAIPDKRNNSLVMSLIKMNVARIPSRNKILVDLYLPIVKDFT